MLQRELKRVEEGHDPKGVIRDRAQNDVIHLPLERQKAHRAEGFEDLLRRHQVRYAPIAEDLVELFASAS